MTRRKKIIGTTPTPIIISTDKPMRITFDDLVLSPGIWLLQVLFDHDNKKFSWRAKKMESENVE